MAMSFFAIGALDVDASICPPKSHRPKGWIEWRPCLSFSDLTTNETRQEGKMKIN